MKKSGLLTLAFVLAALLAMPTLARRGRGGRVQQRHKQNTRTQSRSSGHKRRAKTRSHKQTGRIKAGVKDGSLTNREAGKLAREQKQIHKTAKDARSDGKVTTKEKAQIGHMQNKASRDIAKERHDRQGEMGPTGKTPYVNKRQANQKHRIGQGIKQGSLTKVEVKAIVGKEKEIAKAEREMKEDGTVTKEERKTLQGLLNETSQFIWKEKHDGQNQPRLKVKKSLREQVQSGEMTKKEAKSVLKDMERIHQLKRILATENLAEKKRTALAGELDELVNKTYE